MAVGKPDALFSPRKSVWDLFPPYTQFSPVEIYFNYLSNKYLRFCDIGTSHVKINLFILLSYR